jgi:hypothetical protein
MKSKFTGYFSLTPSHGIELFNGLNHTHLKGIAHHSRFRCFLDLESEKLKQNYASGWYTLNRPGAVHFKRPLTTALRLAGES